MNPKVLAIDGPSGSGKSSTSKQLAIRSNWKYLDTGALYRGATFAYIKNNLESESELIDFLKRNPLVFSCDPKSPTLKLGNLDITDEIRSQQVTAKVSEISQLSNLRELLVSIQREIIKESFPGIVVEGRDIGTVVAPDADLKVFLFADLSARTARREGELKEKIKSAEVSASLERDRKSTRLNSSH